MNKKITEGEILKANIEYHTKLADLYDKNQGHFKLENIKRVEKIIIDLAKKTNGGSLLDIGCGTGFIINIAQKYFDRVVGVDITPAMFKKIKRYKNVELHLINFLSASFKDKFDVCTAYGVLHHLMSPKKSFKRIYQFLNEGGYFYADQDPNFYYLEEIKKTKKDHQYFSEDIIKELKSITKIDEELRGKFRLNIKITKLAEYHKLTKKGLFRKEKITSLLREVGFSEIKFKYQWFLGQGYLKNEFSQKQLTNIENYLEAILPLSRGLFKYISLVAKK